MTKSVIKTTWDELLKQEGITYYLIKNPKGLYRLPTYEGDEVVIRGDRLLVNIVMLMPLLRRGILPLKEGLYIDNEVYTEATRIKQNDSVIFHPAIVELDDGRNEVMGELPYDINHLSNLIASEMASDFCSISMIEISKTMQDPQIQKVLAFNPDKWLANSLKALELATEKHNKTIVNNLKKIVKNNCFRPYLLTGCLNEGQFFQSVCLGGTRTDVDDTAVSVPIYGNYINGLRGNIEYCIESFSARKSDDYNSAHMGDASYTKRKINLMSQSQQWIYPGSCGTDVYVEDVVPKEQIKGHIGRRVINDDGTETTISWKNMYDYADRRITLTSPITCKHTDGVCHRCGGLMAKLLPKKVKIGPVATEQIANPLQQSILSSKHLMKTLILLFVFPEALEKSFDIKDSDIYFEEMEHLDRLMIGVPVEGVMNISELNEFKGDKLPGTYFSDIKALSIADNQTGEIYIPETSLENESGITPYFTSEFLGFLKEHPENVIYNGSTVWFSLKGFDTDQPIMGITYVSEAAYMFIARIEKFFAAPKDKGGIEKYKDAMLAVRDLRNLLWKRIECNSLHVEILVKSALVTSENDYAVPVINDPEGVQFGMMPRINTYRSISTEIAFERIREWAQDPKAYVTITESGILDDYIGFYDLQHPEDAKHIVYADEVKRMR